jgi:DDE superfamily endonuclease
VVYGSGERRIRGQRRIALHYHLLQDSINALGDEDLHLSEDSPVLKKAKKTWNKRPDNWQFIATESMMYGTSSVIKSFKDEFEGLSASAAKQRVITWRNDLKIKKRTPDYRVRMPMYGSAVEEAVLRNANETRAAGLSLDGTILRRYLMVHLEKANLLGLLKENGGVHVFAESWAARFFKRHGFSCRVATSKMRDPPSDVEKKRAIYTKIGSELIYEHNVPPDLVINGDETAVHFVNISNRTFNEKGARKVRMAGVGKDKAQITVTLFVTETGNVLPHQMIFEGLTDRVHPTHPKPDDCIWMHTKSHWQSVETYSQVIKDIIIPYKNRKILELKYPESQVTILKHDLHFTHKDESILALMRDNNIFPLFVPAGCTDIMQECDTVVNKPFKNGVRECYRDHMNDLLKKHRESGKEASTFNARLTMSALKPHVTRFVLNGIAAISTPEMKVTIARAFANDGLFAYMRSPEVQQAIRSKREEEQPLEDVKSEFIAETDNNQDGIESTHSDDEISAFSELRIDNNVDIEDDIDRNHVSSITS